MDKRLWRLCIYGTIISLIILMTVSICLLGFNLVSLVALIIGGTFSLFKMQLGVKILTSLVKGNLANNISGILNVVFYMLSWLIFLGFLAITHKLGINIFWSFVAGYLIIPVMFTILGIGIGTGLIKHNFFEFEKV